MLINVLRGTCKSRLPIVTVAGIQVAELRCELKQGHSGNHRGIGGSIWRNIERTIDDIAVAHSNPPDAA